MKKDKINKKILIVDDDSDILDIYKKRFELEGFSVVMAKDGEEAVAMAENENPDLIMADILLPLMDGITMAEKIKERNKDAKIIFLTNVKDGEYADKIEKDGGFDYLVKADSNMEQIVERVKAKLGVK